MSRILRLAAGTGAAPLRDRRWRWGWDLPALGSAIGGDGSRWRIADDRCAPGARVWAVFFCSRGGGGCPGVGAEPEEAGRKRREVAFPCGRRDSSRRGAICLGSPADLVVGVGGPARATSSGTAMGRVASLVPSMGQRSSARRIALERVTPRPRAVAHRPRPLANRAPSLRTSSVKQPPHALRPQDRDPMSFGLREGGPVIAHEPSRPLDFAIEDGAGRARGGQGGALASKGA